jgi:putative sterol carrier protein
MRVNFQRGAAGDLEATYHFTFTGAEEAQKTVRIGKGVIEIIDGLEGVPTIAVTADTATWLGYLAGEKSLLWALLTRRLRLKGNPKWLVAFGRCFPS